MMKGRLIFILSLLGSALLHGTLFFPPILSSISTNEKLAFSQGNAGLLVKLESLSGRPHKAKSQAGHGPKPQQASQEPILEQKTAGVRERAHSALLIAPEYPEESRLYQEEGTVVVEVSIDQQARAQSLVIISSSQYERLDQAVLTKLRSTHFKDLEGEVLELSFKFELEKRD